MTTDNTEKDSPEDNNVYEVCKDRRTNYSP